MGKGHALSGLIVGCGLAAVAPWAPGPVRLVVALTAGGAALLPDLDHPSSTAARSLGLATRLLARLIAAASLAIYHASRGEADPPHRSNGHRLATHTAPACLLFGLAAAAACLAHPLAGASLVALLTGLLGLGLRIAGASFALCTGGGAYWALTTYPGWWWLYGVAVAAGCAAHLAGDVVTPAGIPIAWPLLREGRRWEAISTPATFDAGGAVEVALVTPLLGVGLLVAASAASGFLSVLVTALGAA